MDIGKLSLAQRLPAPGCLLQQLFFFFLLLLREAAGLAAEPLVGGQLVFVFRRGNFFFQSFDFT